MDKPSVFIGLSVEEAHRKLQADGPNEISQSRVRGYIQLALEIFREPMTILLAVCGLIYGSLGEQQDALMLMAFWAMIVVITFYQERKTEKALEALRRLSSPRALVIRDGQFVRIPAREIVIGDVVQLIAGDIVPADVLLSEVLQVQIDESLLSGESFPVVKRVKDQAWSGSIVVQGQAFGTVTATGERTKLGQIGKILKTERGKISPLKMESISLVKRLTLVAVFLSVLTGMFYYLFNQDLLSAVLVGLTLAMAILPNEIPAVLTIFLTLGTRRLSQRKVLIRKLDAIDSIGATTALCVDKTGTLTLNKMTVKKIVLSPLSQASEKDLLQVASLASNIKTYDPMEKAIAEAFGGSSRTDSPIFQFPHSSDLFAMTNVWRAEDGVFIATKGAPEVIIKMCQLDDERSQQVLAQMNSMAEQGLRILSVARRSCRESEIPKDQINLSLEFLGLVGFADPVRPGVKASIAECYGAGIRVIMITGDHAKTAAAIAAEIGLKNAEKVLTGSEMEKMTDAELAEHLKSANCFSRMIPEQKLRIVKILQQQGEVVAMTGDGVNDAPALAAAQIGIAMGMKGTDVAREAASIVLLDDDFTTIVEGIRVGRGIYDNLRSAMSYLLAVHIPIAGMSILPILLKLPIILMPVHIAFLHLLIEPTCSLVFEAEPPSEDIMRRQPRKNDEAVFSKAVIVPSLIQGLAIYLAIFLVFLLALNRGQGEQDARALAFTILVFANVALIFISRLWFRKNGRVHPLQNKYLWPTVLATLVISMVVLYFPGTRELFHFSVLHPDDLIVAAVAAIGSVLFFELLKYLRMRFFGATRNDRSLY